MTTRILSLLLFVTLLMIGQILIGHYLFHWDGQVGILDANLRGQPSVLFYGDSVIKDSPADEQNHASIASFLASDLIETPVTDLSYGGRDATFFAGMTEHIVRSGFKPTALIVPINLRSFSPEWNQRPILQFDREKFFLQHPAVLGYFFQPLAIFHAFKVPSVSQNEFLNSPVRYGTTTIGLVKDFETLKSNDPDFRRKRFIYSYMGSIDKDNKELVALGELVRLAKQAGIPVYTYITPINYRDGTLLIGKDFIPRIKENTNTICAVVTAAGAPCLNLAITLSTDNFSTTEVAAEHLKEGGRKFVAHEIYLTFFKK